MRKLTFHAVLRLIWNIIRLEYIRGKAEAYQDRPIDPQHGGGRELANAFFEPPFIQGADLLQ